MKEQIRWKELTREQRNKLVAEEVMNATRVKDINLLPESTKKTPDYTTNLNEACLVLLTFTGTAFSYQTQRDLALINVMIDDVNISVTGGAGEECAEAICIAALRAVGLQVHLQS